MTTDCTIIRMLVEDNIYGSVVTHGFANANHWHREMEFVEVVSGLLELNVDGELYSLTDGNIMIIASNVLHTYVRTEPGTLIWVAKVYLKNILSYLEPKDRITEFYKKTLIVKATEKMTDIFHDLVSAQYGIFNECYSGIKASELTIEILSNQNTIKQHINTREVENTDNIYKMKQFVEENLNKDITLTMVADYLGFSTAYCSKYIKKKTNYNFLEFVNLCRLRDAETMLQTTNKGVTDIAYETGFKSIQCFNRVFKKYRGITPTEYKKSLKNKK